MNAVGYANVKNLSRATAALATFFLAALFLQLLNTAVIVQFPFTQKAIIQAYSAKASIKNKLQTIIQQMRELGLLSPEGLLRDTELRVLTSMRYRVKSNDILPGTISGGIRKLNCKTEFALKFFKISK